MENFKTSLSKKSQEDEDDDVNIEFMMKLMNELRVRKNRDEINDMDELGYKVDVDEIKNNKKGMHMTAEEISKYVNKTGFYSIDVMRLIKKMQK